MIVLLDTSTATCHLELVTSTGMKTYKWEAGRTLARGLLRFLRERLEEQGANWDSITGIGVMKGPGSFTGLRIGLTVANTLADSLGVPIIGETGDDWQAHAQERLARGENERIVLPEYGGEAHITKPRK